MKALVRVLLIYICLKLIVAKPQHLQQHAQYHLDPLNEPQFEYPPKDPGKRTIGSYHRHYAFGKHVGIHPSGFKYVLGYSPINLKYVPVIKPVTVLKPVLQESIRPQWKPVVAPMRHYLPQFLHAKPIHQVDHGWKPLVHPEPIHHHKPWVEQVQDVHPVVEEPHAHVHAEQFVSLPAVKPELHNYYYFQTPVAQPAHLPQVPLFHVARPQLGVLPLGASFPAHVFQPTAPGIAHLPPVPAFSPLPAPAPPVFHPTPVHPPIFPVHHPAPVHPQPAPPVFAVHRPVPVPQPAVFPVHPQPPISVEFHGNHHLVPFNHQFSSVPIPKPPTQPHPVFVNRQPHAFPLPPEVQHLRPVEQPTINHQPPHVPSIYQPQVPTVHHNHQAEVPTIYQQPPFHSQMPEINLQAPFNSDAAIQPGQTDVQFPMHLPDHPHFRQIQGMNHFQPVENLQPQLPPFQDHGNILRPSISLEPPITHGHG